MTNFDDSTTRYIDLVSNIEKIQAMAETGTELGKLALERATRQIQELSNNPNVIRDLKETLSSAEDELRQLENSRELVSLGLVSEDEVSDMIKQIQSRPEIRAANTIDNISTLILSHSVVYREEIDSLSSADSNEAIASPRSVRITFLGDGVQIGDKGKFVPLSGRTSDEQRDYSEERKALLRTLVKQQGEFTKISDLWEMTFPGTHFDKDTTRQIKIWLDTLTFRRQPIVLHNSKRGPSSAYGIIDFEVSLNEITTKPIASTISKTENSGNFNKTEEDSIAFQSNESSASSEIEFSANVSFPLNLTESYILAEVISFYSDYCEKHGIERIPESVIGDLKKKMTSTRLLRDSQGRDIIEFRSDIVNKLLSYFDDDITVLGDISAMSDRDDRIKLFHYLLEFDSHERKSILKEIIAGDAKQFITTGGKRGMDLISVETHTSIDRTPSFNSLRSSIDEEDDDLDYDYAVSTPNPDAADTADSTISATSSELLLDSTEELTDSEPDEIGIDEIAENDVVDHKLKEEKKKDEIRLREIEETLQGICDQAIAQNLEKRRGAVGLRGVFSFATSKVIKNASENNLISRDNSNFTLRDILVLNALHHFSDEYAVRKSATKICRRDVDAIIDKIVKKADQ